MKILLITLGTRGDCEPFLGLGNILKEGGHQVVYALPEQYLELVLEDDEKKTLGNEFLDLLDTKVGKDALGGDSSRFKKLLSTIKLGMKSLPLQKKLYIRQREIFDEIMPDLIIYHSKILATIPWCLENKKKSIIFSSVPGVIKVLKKNDYKKNKNQLLNPNVVKTSIHFIARSIRNLDSKKTSLKIIKEELSNSKIIYNISETLFERPNYWSNGVLFSGFIDREKKVGYEIPSDLEAFLKKNEKILFITFGSMVNTNPINKTKIILDIVSKHKIPTIINVSNGGLEKLDTSYSDVLFVKDVPYDYLFDKVHATIHHGGAGTLHSSLKGGAATMCIPHAADQPLWNSIVYKNEFGPKGIHISKFSKKSLEPRLLDLYNNPKYKLKAMSASKRICNEVSKDSLFDFIENI